MKTKLALEIILWHPNNRPYDVYDIDVIKHFWVKLGNKWPKRADNSKLSDMHSQIRDAALTHIADLLDSLAK